MMFKQTSGHSSHFIHYHNVIKCHRKYVILNWLDLLCLHCFFTVFEYFRSFEDRFEWKYI